MAIFDRGRSFDSKLNGTNTRLSVNTGTDKNFRMVRGKRIPLDKVTTAKKAPPTSQEKFQLSRKKKSARLKSQRTTIPIGDRSATLLDGGAINRPGAREAKLLGN